MKILRNGSPVPELNQRSRFSTLWQNLQAASKPRLVLASVLRAYAEPQRAYHTLEHIQDCLARFDEAAMLAKRPIELEGAVWLHDVVYDPRAAENEKRSADWAEDVLARGRVPGPTIERIRTLILATRHLGPPQDPDEALLLDIDLSILGRDEVSFDKYERQIRREYAHVPEPDFRAGRAAILAGFLQRDSIFHTALFRDRYETQARANLSRSLERLRGGQ